MPTAKLEVPTRNFASGAKRGAGDSHGLSAFPHFRGKRFLLGEVVCPPIDRRDSIRDGGLSGQGGRCVFNRESPRTRARSGRKCEYAFPFSNVPRSHSAVIAAWDDAVGKPFRYCSCYPGHGGNLQLEVPCDEIGLLSSGPACQGPQDHIDTGAILRGFADVNPADGSFHVQKDGRGASNPVLNGTARGPLSMAA